MHARRLQSSHGEAVQGLLDRVSMLELSPLVLARALEPFPLPVRTLGALHLASIDYLRARGLELRLASYDARLREVAGRLGIPLAEV